MVLWVWPTLEYGAVGMAYSRVWCCGYGLLSSMVLWVWPTLEYGAGVGRNAGYVELD